MTPHVASCVDMPWRLCVRRRIADFCTRSSRTVIVLISIWTLWVGIGLLNNTTWPPVVVVLAAVAMGMTLLDYWCGLNSRLRNWQRQQWMKHLHAEIHPAYFFGPPLRVYVAFAAAFPGAFLVWLYGSFWLGLDSADIDAELRRQVAWWFKVCVPEEDVW